jgi:hypothetical protein
MWFANASRAKHFTASPHSPCARVAAAPLLRANARAPLRRQSRHLHRSPIDEEQKTMSTSTPAPTHEPPSLPNSPLPKRTKVIDPSPLTHAAGLPRGTESEAGTATPTPLASTASMAALQPPAPIAPSVVAAASAEQQLQVLLLSDKATAPTKGSAYAAGHDLYSAKDMTVPARGRALVGTDISISVPVGTCESPPHLQLQSAWHGGLMDTWEQTAA